MEIRALTCQELNELLALVRKSQWPTPRLTGKPKLSVVRKQESK